MNEERYEFDRNQTYRLISVTDKNGNDKSQSKNFYKSRINCIATDLRYDDYPYIGNFYRARMTFIQTADGLWCRRKLHTSLVSSVEETENGIIIYTHHSIYTFRKETLAEIPYKKEANLIELYMSLDDNNYFGKGFYYDSNQKPHELNILVNPGMFTDTALLYIEEDDDMKYVCRYYLEGRVEFYDTLYGQQDYSTSMLIHNTGIGELEIEFERKEIKKVLAPGESAYISLP